MRIIAIAAALAAALGPSDAPAADLAAADIVEVEGTVIGEATFEQTPTGVLIFVEIEGLPPGAHGIHLHGTGACTPDFKAAKGHINPSGAKHGLRSPDGPDSGDLPNLFVSADGSAKAEFFTTRVTVAPGGVQPALLDADGSAVIVHDRPDDHSTQPIGGAGGRIACGVIAKR